MNISITHEDAAKWRHTAGTPKLDGTLNLRELTDFSLEELNELRSIITTQIEECVHDE